MAFLSPNGDDLQEKLAISMTCRSLPLVGKSYRDYDKQSIRISFIMVNQLSLVVRLLEYTSANPLAHNDFPFLL